MKRIIRFTVSGLVQGVGFRYFVYTQASKLNLEGYAKNLRNGDVEVVVSADADEEDLMLKALKQGPSRANVTNVKLEYEDSGKSFNGFEIL